MVTLPNEPVEVAEPLMFPVPVVIILPETVSIANSQPEDRPVLSDICGVDVFE